MTEPSVPLSRLSRFLMPHSLFLGVVVGLVACSVAGRIASKKPTFKDVERFHALITPESLFYPTASQVKASVLSRLDPDKILVIVGGSSVFHGTGQKRDQLWTRKLQERLGPRYLVVNLAVRSGGPEEFGATVAEMLLADHPRLILVDDCQAGQFCAHPDGNHYRYFFWDAYWKGYLQPDPGRDARLQEAAPVRSEQRQECQRRMLLDSILFSEDLWNLLAYDKLMTLWTPLSRQAASQPRKRRGDPELGAAPLARRAFAGQLAAIRRVIDKPACIQPLPQVLAGRTLVVVRLFAPPALSRLPESVQATYQAKVSNTVARLEEMSIAALTVGGDFSAADYADGWHFSESGGARLAAAVSPRVQDLARRLGYLD